MANKGIKKIDNTNQKEKKLSLKDRDWTKGNVVLSILLLSGPLMVTQVLNMIGQPIDMYWVGKLGTTAMAGVSTGGALIRIMITAMMGLGVGMRAIIARFVGEGDHEGAIRVAMHGFIAGGIYTLLVVTVGVLFARPALTLLGVEPDVIAEGVPYVRIMSIGMAIMTFRMICEGVMQASGDATTPLKISIFFRVTHFILDPLLILGVWIFPRMGVSGAALTNVLAQSFGLMLGIWILFSGRTRLKLVFTGFYFDFDIMWRIIKVGFPFVIIGMQMSIQHLTMMKMVVPFGTVAVAAHASVGTNIDMFLIMMIMGLGLGSGVMAGQNIGAGKPERARKAAWAALGFSEIICFLYAGFVFFYAEYIVSAINNDPQLVELASSFLRITCVGYLAAGFIAVLKHTIAGAGDTVPAMIVELGHMWVVMVPLAYFLSHKTGLGMFGIRWAVVVGVYAGALGYYIYFRTGKWQFKKV